MTVKILEQSPPALYAAFDLFPSRKGAAIHINKFARALFEEMDGGVLYVLGNEKLPVYQIEENVEIVRFNFLIKNYLQRALAFSERFEIILDECENDLKIVLIKSIFAEIISANYFNSSMSSPAAVLVISTSSLSRVISSV
jgi:hypothetical protein